MNKPIPLQDLPGSTLSSVNFVRDYVVFDFNGPTLASITNPVIHKNGRAEEFPQAGSRDALCMFIGEKLMCISVKEDVAITMGFRNGEIIIPLDRRSRINPDAAIYVPGVNQPVQVY